ncbi:Alanine--glyoxylate aminotransferase 1, partial [Lachnellula arida]
PPFPCCAAQSATTATSTTVAFRRLYPAINKVAPHERLSVISRHLDTCPAIPPNTSYSVESSSSNHQIKRFNSTSPSTEKSKMSSQANHPALLIPGPIEFDDAVLQSMSHYSESHVGAPFVATFGETLSMLRKLFQTTDPTSQPFVISGSGTLGWDLVAANLAEPGDDVLVLHTGYFADSFSDCFETYGVKATQLKAPIGSRPQLPEIEKALKEKKYKLLTVTHVDTSTGVLSELKALSELVHRVSPETLLIVDGPAKKPSVAPQLSISMYSGRAIKSFQSRKTPPGSYFASFKNWLPIMQNYEAKKPSYFATPSPQLIHALHTSLKQILSKPLSERFAAHRETSQKIKKAVTALGLKQLASDPADQANGMTAVYLPENVKAPELLPNLLKKGVIFAGGLHKEIAAKYIRVGHMGVSVTDPKRDDVDRAIKALETGLSDAGYQKA